MMRDVLGSEAARIAAWTLLHLCWQGAIVGVVAFVALRLVRRASPTARYAVALAAFVSLLLIPMATAFRLASQSSRDARVARDPVASRINADSPIGLPLSAVVAARPTTIEEKPRPSVWTTRTQQWMNAAARFAPGVIVLWLVGVIVFAIRLALDMRCVYLLRRGAGCPPSDEIQAAVDRIANDLRIRPPVRVIVAPRARGPAVVGMLSPVVLVPLRLAADLTPIQRDLLLAHELAHISRRDHLVNVVQAIAEVAFFFQPVVWWLSRILRDEREHCCDDVAARRTGGAYELAQALLILEEQRGPAQQRLVMAARSGSLLSRVQRLLAPPSRRTAAGISATIAAAVAGVGLWVTVAAAAVTPSGIEGSSTMSLRGRVSDPVRPARGNAPPRYPDALRTQGVEGSVLVQFTVDTLGRVKADDIAILSSTHESFTVAVRSAAASMRFIPATLDGKKTKQPVQVPFVFYLEGLNDPLQSTAGLLAQMTVTARGGADASRTLRLEPVVTSAIALSPAPMRGDDDSRVDRRATAKRGNVPPLYPEQLRSAGVDGEVVAQFVVDGQGRPEVGSFSVIRATDPRFAAAVRDVFAAWRFEPTQSNGGAVKHVVRVPVQFSVLRP